MYLILICLLSLLLLHGPPRQQMISLLNLSSSPSYSFFFFSIPHMVCNLKRRYSVCVFVRVLVCVCSKVL